MSELYTKKPGHGWRCPHCMHEMRIRTSETVHPMMRRSFLQCMRAECSAAFAVTAEIERQLSPSGIPDPETETVMNELNHRYEKRRSARPKTPSETAIVEGEKPTRFQSVDHTPGKPSPATLTLNRTDTDENRSTNP